MDKSRDTNKDEAENIYPSRSTAINPLRLDAPTLLPKRPKNKSAKPAGFSR